MSVKQSLLAILDQGPCYGYQLRAEFDRRTGSTWPLNVGQIYNTLDRLERDGLVTKGDADAQGHIYFEITDSGRSEAKTWLESPVRRGSGWRDELAIKVAVAATLPGVDATRMIEAQHAASVVRLQGLRVDDHPTGSGPEELARSLVRDAQIYSAEAEVRWLEHAATMLAAHPEHVLTLELSTDRPKRGRPVSASPATRENA